MCTHASERPPDFFFSPQMELETAPKLCYTHSEIHGVTSKKTVILYSQFYETQISDFLWLQSVQHVTELNTTRINTYRFSHEIPQYIIT